MIKRILIIMCLLVCQNALAGYDILLGCWEFKLPSSVIRENWKKISDNLYVGTWNRTNDIIDGPTVTTSLELRLEISECAIGGCSDQLIVSTQGSQMFNEGMPVGQYVASSSYEMVYFTAKNNPWFIGSEYYKSKNSNKMEILSKGNNREEFHIRYEMTEVQCQP
jgi:hypothetical protein